MKFNKLGLSVKALAVATAMGIGSGEATEEGTLKLQSGSTDSHITPAFLNETWIPKPGEAIAGARKDFAASSEMVRQVCDSHIAFMKRIGPLGQDL